MDIVQSNEAFKTVGGKFQFQYVAVIVRYNGSLYTAKWAHRTQQPSEFSQLDDIKPIITEDRGPIVETAWQIGPADGCYFKTPSLSAYTSNVDLEGRISREIETCEILRKNPHRNIASYLGCREIRGRVSGLCFKHYKSTLLDRVNPQHLNKRAFLSSNRHRVNRQLEFRLNELHEGIKHLHSLGLVHNDINPANIMYDEDDTLVLIDFDSCRQVGESLLDTETKRTHGWHDTTVQVASVENDLAAFQELRIWLFGSAANEYLFRS